MHQQYIDQDDIFQYMYNGIIKRGYTPDSDTLIDVTEIVMDFLVDAGIVEIIDE